MQKKQNHPFKLEGLEPRLLLSGDASAVAADFTSDLEHIPVLVEKLQTDHLNQQLPLIGQNLADVFDPSAQLQNLFSGLTDSNIDTLEKLATALDAEQGVDANLVEQTDDGFTLDLGISDIFDGVVPLSVEPQDSGSAEQSYSEDFSLLGHINLTGDWALNLRLIADSDNDDVEFTIDSALSFLRVNTATSDPILDSGWYDGVAVSSISDMLFQANFETKFTYDVNLSNLSQTGGNGLDLATTTSMIGHAALTVQLVKSLNAAHGPPEISLSWENTDFYAEPIAKQYVTSGTGLLENKGLDVDGFLLPGLNATTGPIEGLGTVRFNENFDLTDALTGISDLHTGIAGQQLDFNNPAERVFDGLDPPTFLSFLSDPSDFSNATGVDPAAPFEFVIASTSPTDLTLRLNGEHLEIVDTLAGTLLARRALASTSEIVIHGVDNVDDTLTVDFNNGIIEAPIMFHGGDRGFDSLVFKGDGESSVNYTAIGTDSATMLITGRHASTTLSFTGLEPVTFSNLASLTFDTNDPSIFADSTAPGTPGVDIITIDSPAAGQNRINGTSGGKVFENVTFFDIATVTLDLGLNDTVSDQDDRVTIDSSGLVATGLQNLIINGGDGRDEVILQSGITLPVAGGALTFNGEAGDDYLVVHSGSTADITFNGGNGTDAVVNEVGTSGTFSGTDVENSIGLVTLVVNAFDDAAELVADIKSQIDATLNTPLPLINQSLNDLIGDPTDGLDFDLFGAFASALGTVTSAVDLDALEEGLEDALGLADGGDPDFDNPELEITFVDAVLAIVFDFGLSANSTLNLVLEDAGLPMSGSLPLDLALAFDLNFDLSLDFGQLDVTVSSAADSFLVSLNELQVQANLSSPDLDVNLTMDGVGSLAVIDGTADFSAALNVGFSSGTSMTVADLVAADLATLFALTPSGTVSIVLPTSVSGGKAGIFDISATGTTSLTVADVFGSPDVELTLDVSSANIDVAGFMGLSGAFALRAQGQDFWGIGTGLTARMEAGSAFVEVTSGNLGLITGDDTFAFEMQGGSATFALDPLANITAGDISMQYADASTTVAAGTAISIGTQSFTFVDGISPDSATLSIQGFSADVLGLVTISGDLGFVKATGDFTVADGTTSTQLTGAEYLAVGVSNLTGSMTAGGVGLTLSSIELAMVLVEDDVNSINYTAIKASIGSASLTGISGLTLTVNSLSLLMNQTDDAANPNKVLDFADTTSHSGDDGAAALSIATGSSSSVTIDLDGDEGSLLQLAGNVDFDVFGFVTLTGDFGFKTASGDFTVADGTTSTQLTGAEYLAIGATNTTGSVGAGGVGIALSGVELGMVLVSDDDNSVNYTTIKASIGSVSLTGIPGMTVNSLSLLVNQTDDDANPSKVLDFADTASHSGDDAATALSIATGSSSSVTIDLDGDEGSLLQLAGSVDFDVFGFVTLSGDFAFKTATGNFTVADGSTSTQLTSVDYLAVGGNISTASVGVGGVGLTLNSIELAMVRVSDDANSVEYTAIVASVGSASFTGIPGLTLSVNSLSLLV